MCRPRANWFEVFDHDAPQPTRTGSASIDVHEQEGKTLIYAPDGSLMMRTIGFSATDDE